MVRANSGFAFFFGATFLLITGVALLLSKLTGILSLAILGWAVIVWGLATSFGAVGVAAGAGFVALWCGGIFVGTVLVGSLFWLLLETLMAAGQLQAQECYIP